MAYIVLDVRQDYDLLSISCGPLANSATMYSFYSFFRDTALPQLRLALVCSFHDVFDFNIYLYFIYLSFIELGVIIW